MIDVQELRRLAEAATVEKWELWDGSSWRRIDIDWRYIVAAQPRNILSLLDRLAAAEAPLPERYACQRCGRRDGLDAVVDDVTWARLVDGVVNPGGEVTGGKWNILCLWCMDKLATEKGIATGVNLYFAGDSLFGSCLEPCAEEASRLMLTRRYMECAEDHNRLLAILDRWANAIHYMDHYRGEKHCVNLEVIGAVHEAREFLGITKPSNRACNEIQNEGTNAKTPRS